MQDFGSFLKVRTEESLLSIQILLLALKSVTDYRHQLKNSLDGTVYMSRR